MGTGDHAVLHPYFGLDEQSIPDSLYSEIETIIADSTEIFSGYSLNYLYGSNADYGLDALEAGLGTPLNHSQDDAVRSVYYDSGLYRTIASSSFFGAMADGVDDNTKANVMIQYLSFLNGDPSPNIVVSEDELNFGITSPNINYTLELEISNIGLETLFVSDVVISGEGFSYLGLTEFELDTSDQQVLEIVFEMDEIGDYSGELTIFSNDPDTPELLIPLTTECLTEADDDLNFSANKLIGNYPNPFNPTTMISFEVTQTSPFVNLEIYNLKGQRVKQLVNKTLHTGQHSIVWNGTDNNNRPVSSGIYFYQLKSSGFEQTKKMILMK